MYSRDSADSDDKCHLIAGFQTAEPAEEKMEFSGQEVLDGFLLHLDEIFRTDLKPASCDGLVYGLRLLPLVKTSLHSRRLQLAYCACYFASGNYGFVKFLTLNDRCHGDNDCRVKLITEAISVVNKYAQTSGYHTCDEIFSMVCKKPKSTMANKRTWSEQCKYLYATGFRLIDTDGISSDISSESCVLVYKPDLLPNYQVEGGIVGDHIRTNVLLNFCEDLIGAMDSSDDGKQAAKQIQALVNIFKESSRLMLNTVKPSFPWKWKSRTLP
ncbi:hypothetical protein OS493_024663 [Desmophyllum pertusum]|uniref:Uncharacterized protein n=1 Tax=Desmophyllum pertusum TaxID=174260 RepID=A0A9W9ZLL0_9CNID|nr:hypothetical protein OS493_024663 [Desmophyllum pertusum]